MSDVNSKQAKDAIVANIAERLHALGWSRYKLAKETDLSLPTIINICDGVNEPSVSKLKTIAVALDTTTDKLLEQKAKKAKLPA